MITAEPKGGRTYAGLHHDLSLPVLTGAALLLPARAALAPALAMAATAALLLLIGIVRLPGIVLLLVALITALLTLLSALIVLILTHGNLLAIYGRPNSKQTEYQQLSTHLNSNYLNINIEPEAYVATTRLKRPWRDLDLFMHARDKYRVESWERPC
jgi:hypothetical protein